MARVLVPGGQLMIYVWAMEQKNRHFEKQDVLVPWNRAWCSRLLSAPRRPGRRPQCGPAGPGRPCRPPCAVCSCPVCFEEPRDPKRSHSMDRDPARARACCARISKEGGGENGFYNTLGKSFRSWFCSRSLDESTLGKHLERGRPLKTTGWAAGTVSVQPSRYPSFDRAQPWSAGEQSLDEGVFVETPASHLAWLRAPATAEQLHGDRRGDSRTKGHGNFLRRIGSSAGRHQCVAAGTSAGGNPSSETLRRLSAERTPDATSPVGGQGPGGSDPGACMRYYHVFREGELCALLRENVSELEILSAGNDHGNWCVIAEKREDWH